MNYGYIDIDNIPDEKLREFATDLLSASMKLKNCIPMLECGSGCGACPDGGDACGEIAIGRVIREWGEE